MTQGKTMQAGKWPGESGCTKKVTVFMGSGHKEGATCRAARWFLEDLESYGDIHGEIVDLSDRDLGVCRGCKNCLDRGEERCPLRDDRDLLIEKLTASDGVVFASPNYSFQVSTVMKIFLDRLGFLFHRPRFHGKTFAAIVVQGIGGGGKIVEYLQFVGRGLGFNVVKGSCIRTLQPMDQTALESMKKKLAKQSRRFHARLLQPAFPAPSLFWLMIFRMTRTALKLTAREEMRDYVYYRDNGLFGSDYYYAVRLGLFKKAAGAFFDWAGARMFRPPKAAVALSSGGAA